MDKFMTLYEVEQKFIEAIDEETGEILISEEEFENLVKNEEQGLEYFIRLYKNKKAYAEALKAEEKSLKERRERLEKSMDGIKERLDAYLKGNKFECVSGKVNYRKSTSTNVDMEAFLQWDGRFPYLKFEPTADKKALAELVDNGAEIPGVTREVKMNCSIS